MDGADKILGLAGRLINSIPTDKREFNRCARESEYFLDAVDEAVGRYETIREYAAALGKDVLERYESELGGKIKKIRRLQKSINR